MRHVGMLMLYTATVFSLSLSACSERNAGLRIRLDSGQQGDAAKHTDTITATDGLLGGDALSDVGASDASCKALDPDAQIPSAPSGMRAFLGGADYDGDDKTDFGVWEPSTGRWQIIPSGGGATIEEMLGEADDIPMPADYDGDGKTDIAVWRASNGNWLIKPSSGGPISVINWGVAGDIPLPGNFNDEIKADHTVYRDATGIFTTKVAAGTAVSDLQLSCGATPVPADFDGDDVLDRSVWLAGTWTILASINGATLTHSGGVAGDIPVPANFNDDFDLDFAVWNIPNARFEVTVSAGSAVSPIAMGDSTSLPVPADYDGDGIADAAVFSSTTFTVRQSTDSQEIQQAFTGTDLVPVSGVIVRN